MRISFVILILLISTKGVADEPVIQPKTAKQLQNPPVVQPGVKKAAETTEGAVLPLYFVKNKISSMPNSTKNYIAVESVKCDSARRCWLHPDNVYGTANEGRVIQITKDGDGYHMILEGVEHKWVAQELPSGVKWLPVKTISAK